MPEPFDHPCFVAAMLCAAVASAEWFARHTWLRHLGASLVVIVVGALFANTGVIPVGESPVYSGVFSYVAQLAIFLLLLRVNLRDIMAAGLPMVGLFLLACLATVAGVLAGLAVVGGAEAFGDLRGAIGGLFVATYTGGSVNFNAVALEYEVAQKNQILFGATVAVDSIATAIWMVATIAVPRLCAGFWPGASCRAVEAGTVEAAVAETTDVEHVGPFDVGLLLGSGLGALWLSTWLAARFEVPSILVLTTIALMLAQFRFIVKLPGSRMLGMFAVQVFLAVIGACCDLAAIERLGTLGLTLVAFVAVLIVVHGLVMYGIAALCRADVAMVSVASQAAIGGGTTALALARSLERDDLELPGILVGALGNALGTYLGLAVASMLVTG